MRRLWYISILLLLSVGMLMVISACGGESKSPEDTSIPPSSVGMIALTAEAFTMGDIAGDSGNTDEVPSHLVIVRDFHISDHEVTLGEYRNYVSDHNNHLSTGCNFADCPVTNVSWDEAQTYISWLNTNAPLRGGLTYRLCTEAEWEFAARAGTTTRWSCGEDESCLSEVAWYASNATGLAHIVKGKNANGFGLYDMHGNVQEWVQDWYDVEYYSASPLVNPTGPESSSLRSVRGGYFANTPSQIRSAKRQGAAQTLHTFFIGIRLCAQ